MLLCWSSPGQRMRQCTFVTIEHRETAGTSGETATVGSLKFGLLPKYGEPAF